MVKENILLIVNPISGRGKSLKIFPIIKNYLNEHGIKYEFIFTEYRSHATELAKKLKQREDIKLIVAVGGDGTINEIINGLYPANIPIGYIPTGTGNDFARALGISNDPITALKRILQMNTRLIDVGKINGHYFLNVASMGFDAEVAKIANESSLKKLLGSYIYVYGVIKALWSFKPKEIDITIDGISYNYHNLWILAVANNQFYGGGMQICPDALNDDGSFDICIIKDLTRLKLIKLFPSIFSGNHINYPMVKILNGKNITVNSKEDLAIQSDGEILSNIELTISNIHKGIKVV